MNSKTLSSLGAHARSKLLFEKLKTSMIVRTFTFNSIITQLRRGGGGGFTRPIPRDGGAD